MLKDFGIAEPQRVIVPQGRASFEAIGSNSPVAVESTGSSGQFSSADFAFLPEAPCSLQAVRAKADSIRDASAIP